MRCIVRVSILVLETIIPIKITKEVAFRDKLLEVLFIKDDNVHSNLSKISAFLL